MSNSNEDNFGQPLRMERIRFKVGTLHYLCIDEFSFDESDEDDEEEGEEETEPLFGFRELATGEQSLIFTEEIEERFGEYLFSENIEDALESLDKITGDLCSLQPFEVTDEDMQPLCQFIIKKAIERGKPGNWALWLSLIHSCGLESPFLDDFQPSDFLYQPRPYHEECLLLALGFQDAFDLHLTETESETDGSVYYRLRLSFDMDNDSDAEVAKTLGPEFGALSQLCFPSLEDALNHLTQPLGETQLSLADARILMVDDTALPEGWELLKKYKYLFPDEDIWDTQWAWVEDIARMNADEDNEEE